MKVKITTVAILGLASIGAFYATLGAQPPPSRSVWDGVFTQKQAKRGQALYNEQCASCHGDTLEGVEMAPPLAGVDFLSNWDGLTVGDLFERVRKTMPLNKPGKLSREANADVLAYVLSVNEFPAGQKELAHQAEFLKEIRIEAAKPERKENEK